jgi:glutaconate CoA-transferase subunit A
MSQRKSKLVSAREALAGLKDGTSIICGGVHLSNTPMALVRQLIRQGVRDLEIIPTPATGLWVDLLIAADAVAKVHVSYIGLEFLGLAPNFRRAVEARRISISEVDEPTIFHGLRASASGMPFVALPPIHLLTDLPRVNPDVYKVVTNPFTGEPAVAIPPLKPDVCLVHVAKADIFGNGLSLGGRHMEDIITKASGRVILSAEEIVETSVFSDAPTQTTIPGVLVDCVVHAPFGAYPGACPGVYNYDRPHLLEYNDLAKAGSTRDYIERYVRAHADDAAMLADLGASRLDALKLGS